MPNGACAKLGLVPNGANNAPICEAAPRPATSWLFYYITSRNLETWVVISCRQQDHGEAGVQASVYTVCFCSWLLSQIWLEYSLFCAGLCCAGCFSFCHGHGGLEPAHCTPLAAAGSPRGPYVPARRPAGQTPWQLAQGAGALLAEGATCFARPPRVKVSDCPGSSVAVPSSLHLSQCTDIHRAGGSVAACAEPHTIGEGGMKP